MWPFQTRKKALWTSTASIFTPLPMFALGAAAMYYLDPERGRRRRALVRDQFISAWCASGDNLRKSAQYTRGRARGLVAEARASLSDDHPDNWTLRERVRSALGRAVSHPGAIHVSCSAGVVTLAGPVLAAEVDRLLSAVQHVRGVHEVLDRLEVHQAPGDVPALQGQPRRSRMRSGLAGESWDPFTRLVATAGGAGLALWGVARRDALSLVAGAAGAALAVRGLSNLPASRLRGFGAGNEGVHVQKTITIFAPRPQVFDFFARYENFPHFMRNVREVLAYGDSGRSHWVVAGPMGSTVSWDAELRDFAPGERIAWCSLPGATVDNAGVIRFSDDRGGTRVEIRLSYTPPAGALGHVIARLFGADPKSEMDEDLVRVKTMLETGNPPHDAAQMEQAARL